MSVSDEFGWLTVLSILASALLSGLLGVWVSNRSHKLYEIKQAKLKVLQQLMGSRYKVNGKEFLGALNQVAVVFCDSKEVLTALNTVAEDTMMPNRNGNLSNQRLLVLFKAMFKNLGINPEPLTDNFFLIAFIPTDA